MSEVTWNKGEPGTTDLLGCFRSLQQNQHRGAVVGYFDLPLVGSLERISTASD